jgi:hypothetical protein
MLKEFQLYLSEASNSEVKACSLQMGYTFTDEDVQELRRESHLGETVEDALNDYLDAYER